MEEEVTTQDTTQSLLMPEICLSSSNQHLVSSKQ